MKMWKTQSLGSGRLMEFTPLARHIGYNSEAHTENFSMTSSGKCKQKINAKSTLGSSCMNHGYCANCFHLAADEE